MTRAFLEELADGTVKQLNPFTGTEVWTVPGRGHRPFGVTRSTPSTLAARDFTHTCAFCSGRYLETPPEKSRIVRSPAGWQAIEASLPETLFDTRAEFRRVPNLFEILGYDYWHLNHGYLIPAPIRRRRDLYLASAEGRAHIVAVMSAKLRASGIDPMSLSETEIISRATGFFGGGHDVVIARRHYVDGAATDAELASSGTLTTEEHAQFIRYCSESALSGYQANPEVRYVVVFQNWLGPAGASFDHLHKQIVAIDEQGGQNVAAMRHLSRNPNAFNDDALNIAVASRLVIAANQHCVAFAGFGHRYPTIEVFSRSANGAPWEHTEQELRGISDVLHAVHAAIGADVPCNEEWHYRPPELATPMPWRIMVKLRISTLAGFEGATKIYLNTVSPTALRDRLVPRLHELRASSAIAADLAIADEADVPVDALRYLG